MRNLTSIESAYRVNAYFEVYITPTDASTTWIFNQNDIKTMSPINFEIPFLGGFGKTSNYRVTLQTSVDWIKTYKSKIINADISIEMYLNEDDFRPHAGIITDYTLNTKDLNVLTLNVFDKFYHQKKVFPPTLMSDSFDTLPPAVLNENLATPYYYGLVSRPAYYTPVNSDLTSFLKPFNTYPYTGFASYIIDKSFGSHEKDLAKWVYIRNPSLASAVSCYQTATTSEGFQIQDTIFGGESLLRYNRVTNSNTLTNPISETRYLSTDYRALTAVMGVQPNVSSRGEYEVIYTVEPLIDLGKTIDIAGQFLVYSASYDGGDMKAYVSIDSGEGTLDFLVASLTTAVFSFTTWWVPLGFGTGGNLLINSLSDWASKDRSSYLKFYFLEDKVPGVFKPTVQVFSDGYLTATIQKNSYKNRSVLGFFEPNSSVAISQNPIKIITDIFTKTNIDFTDVNCIYYNTWTKTESYNFECYFDQQEKVSDIADDFGRATATYMWAGDSGMINYRSYQESSTVTINKTLSTSDFQNLEVTENPLGITINETKKASNINLDYDYDFTSENYGINIKADKNNNSFCNSISAAGISNTQIFKTKYVRETFTASLYLTNLVRKFTGGDTVIKTTLGANHFDLELADVIKVEHPVLNNSSSVFQITKLGYDFMKGEVRITANELKNVN